MPVKILSSEMSLNWKSLILCFYEDFWSTISFFYVCLQELTTALEKNPDDAKCYCQRAYAHILLQKYAGNIFSLRILLQGYHNMCFTGHVTGHVFNLKPNTVMRESVICNSICWFWLVHSLGVFLDFVTAKLAVKWVF